ncbi:calpain cysteine protease family protein [Aspergillus niger]|nr:calpain cysteine protease family protein [Aspergillus niger]
MGPWALLSFDHLYYQSKGGTAQEHMRPIHLTQCQALPWGKRNFTARRATTDLPSSAELRPRLFTTTVSGQPIMPIPTRSLSLREPRKQNSTTVRTTTTTTTTTTGKPASTTSTSATSTSSSAATSTENLVTRSKSLLPVRDEGRATRPSRLQQPSEPRVAQRTSKASDKAPQSQPAQENTGITRRQSLIRPSPLKPSAPLKPTSASSRRPTVAPSPSSPVKQEIPSRQNGRPLSPKKTETLSRQNGPPLSPKKTDMPPPPRLARSASLRQPAAPSSSTPTVTRGHARHRSQGIATPSGGQSPRKVDPPSPFPTSATVRSRAQLSTYQQPLSPKKVAKPATATQAAAPPAVDADSSLLPSSWPEIAALQTELLQLSLVHLSSCKQHNEWETTAEARLRRDYNLVAGDYQAALADEKEYQRQLNGHALHHWLENTRERNGQRGFAEQIRILSQVAEEVYNLSDNLDGRHTVAVQEFEVWFQRVEEIRTIRFHHGRNLDQVVFIDPLNHGWRDETSALVMKLELCLRQLQSLDILGYGDPGPLGDSALFRTAKGLEEMASMMVEELNTIRKIESDVVKSEREWVSQLARQLTANQAHDQKRPTVGMWRRPSLNS